MTRLNVLGAPIVERDVASLMPFLAATHADACIQLRLAREEAMKKRRHNRLALDRQQVAMFLKNK